MMAALNTAAITAALTTQITPVPLSGVLYRGVRLTTLLSKDPPQPLYVSTSENRFNLDGTRVLYFGENFVTAYSETVQENANLLRDSPIREHKTGAGYDVGDENEEPVVLFAARAAIENVLDLTDPGILAALKLTKAALIQPWRWESKVLGRPALTQQLGEAVFQTGNYQAIRYRSQKAADPDRMDEAAAWAIFVDRLTAPSFVEVSDVTKRLQGKLP